MRWATRRCVRSGGRLSLAPLGDFSGRLTGLACCLGRTADRLYGAEYSYSLCPRGMIFRRDQESVNNMGALQKFMQVRTTGALAWGTRAPMVWGE